ncbi:JM165 [macacine gammaherpesvirus 11]|uniref:JM165 n=2 Tax=macacine gammaherpesvirus 11 TaxID=2560570 RepID=G9JMZ2_9GAMA|nr:JM165 [Macaca fuscata rhadinovirus]AAT00142.1 JM165 [Macaca fuscata rhadinovirus]AEW87689.1 JM165 [Macaca fuscata rhadinovirus]AEW87859.1 JM165 [Macaca fuscata rhadinovirus]
MAKFTLRSRHSSLQANSACCSSQAWSSSGFQPTDAVSVMSLRRRTCASMMLVTASQMAYLAPTAASMPILYACSPWATHCPTHLSLPLPWVTQVSGLPRRSVASCLVIGWGRCMGTRAILSVNTAVWLTMW